MVMYVIMLLSAVWSFHAGAVSMPTRSSEHKIAILGLGGRSQYLLLECMQQNPNIRIVAVCDDHGSHSFNWFMYSLQRSAGPMFAQAYGKLFEKAQLYPDTDEGLKKLFQEHSDLDSVLITSSNDKHLKHLSAALAHSPCKNVYMEKPLFRTLEEFQKFKDPADDVTISIGLTLRYANMTKIVIDTLQQYREQLGDVTSIKSWERLNFGHALTIIMMNWRRYISKSGGLLLEKSIHDLDLGLFFMRALNVEPEEIVITTNADHRLFKKSQKKNILKSLTTNDELRNLVAGWNGVAFQRVIQFAADKRGYLDVEGTLDKIFEDFPDNDNFKKSDIIPDHQVLKAMCKTASGKSVAFELEVDMSSLRLTSERGIRFEFEHGTVLVDIMKSEMIITLQDGTSRTIDLHTNNSGHAGGDAYIAQVILGTLPAGRYRATMKDETVQLATLMGLVSEQQAVGKRKQGITIKKGDNNKWSL